tara:strand:- start:100903 stop:101511 length:609 start_codon:yes stop_codon:yes gene_type:complete
MTAKRKKNSKRNRRLLSISRANKLRQIQASQSQIKEDPNKRLSKFQSILKYRKLIPLGLIFFLISSYIIFYPDNIKVENKLLGSEQPLSDALILINTNPYELNVVQIKIKSGMDLKLSNGLVMDGNISESENLFKSIKPKKSKTIKTNDYKIKGGNIVEIKNAFVQISLSYNTPFMYPNVKNDTFSFIGVLNSNKEIIYLPN